MNGDKITIRQDGARCRVDTLRDGVLHQSEPMGRVAAKHLARKLALQFQLPLYNVKKGGKEILCS